MAGTGLTLAVASRALFDLEEENDVFETQGAERYAALQASRVHDVPGPGPAFALAHALGRLNVGCDPLDPPVKVVLVTRNGPSTGLRLLHPGENGGVVAMRAMMTGGRPVVPWLARSAVDLFLTRSPQDARDALAAGVPVAVVAATDVRPEFDGEIRVAFDGDAVLFDDESERAFEVGGYEGWARHEEESVARPLGRGPLLSFALALSGLRGHAALRGVAIRVALVTAREGLSRRRALTTLERWGVHLDEAYFLGGWSKADVVRDFRPTMFFDDRPGHVDAVPFVAPSGLVPRSAS